jgi:hypothetical protein
MIIIHLIFAVVPIIDQIYLHLLFDVVHQLDQWKPYEQLIKRFRIFFCGQKEKELIQIKQTKIL